MPLLIQMWVFRLVCLILSLATAFPSIALAQRWYDGLVKPDVIAPGQALAAIADPSMTLYQNPALHAAVAPYLKLSGTSMGAGVASGVVALLIEANRLDEGPDATLTPNVIKALLQFTSIPLPDADTTTPSIVEQGTGGIKRNTK